MDTINTHTQSIKMEGTTWFHLESLIWVLKDFYLCLRSWAYFLYEALYIEGLCFGCTHIQCYSYTHLKEFSFYLCFSVCFQPLIPPKTLVRRSNAVATRCAWLRIIRLPLVSARGELGEEQTHTQTFKPACVSMLSFTFTF